MIMRKDQRYRCQNPNCRGEIEVMTNSGEEDSNARCHCGAKVKKVYSKPVFRELSHVEAIARAEDTTIPKSALALLSVTVSGVHRGAWYTNQNDSFLKFMRIREDTAAITWRVYVEPAVRKVDFASRLGKRLPAEVQTHEPGRRKRVMLHIPVLIHVQLPDGRSLRHDGFTLVVNAHGCVFTMETKLEVGQHIVLVNPKSGLEQSGIVTRVQKSRDGGYAVAFEFDNSTLQLWSHMFFTKDAKVERF